MTSISRLGCAAALIVAFVLVPAASGQGGPLQEVCEEVAEEWFCDSRYVHDAKLTPSDGTVVGQDWFGSAVALDGSVALVSAPGADVGLNDRQGAAYVFERDRSVWVEQTKLTASDGRAEHWFGDSVALAGDTALIGAARAEAAYVFERIGSGWVEQAKLVPDDKAEAFGVSVALDGDTALIGAPGARVEGEVLQGAAYVFERSGSSWTQEAKLTASDGNGSDQLGFSAALEDDTVLVGAGGVDEGQGAVYAFEWNGSAWVEQAKLVASDGVAHDQLGTSVALDGDVAVAGASLADVDGEDGQGAAYVFERTASGWVEQAKLAASDGAENAAFGVSVDVDDGAALVGADRADVGGDEAQGAAYLYERNGSIWTEQVKLTALDGTSWEQFGEAVALDGEAPLVGAPDAESDRGSAYVYRQRSDWT